MAGPRPVEGGRALLFERLVDLEPGQGEARPFVLHDGPGLRESVRTELERLLSTRLSLPPGDLAHRHRSTIDYGIPDGAVISPADPLGRALLAEQIATAIRSFEPRLLEPAVSLHTQPERGESLIAEIAGHLDLGPLLEPICFAIPLGNDHER
mgnify:FL=1